LAVYFNKLALLVSIFFGVDISPQATQMQNVADSSADAALAQEELGTATAEAGKKAKGSLAAWDDLNVLQQQDTEASLDVPEIITPELDTVKVDEGLSELSDKVNAFKEKLMGMFGPAIAAFELFKEKLGPLKKTLWEGLEWAWNNILKPFGAWVITSFLPKFFDLMAAGVRLLNAALIILKPVLLWLWDYILKPWAAGVGLIIEQSIMGWTMAFNDLATWLESHPNLFAIVIQSADLAWERIKEIWANAGEWIRTKVIEVIKGYFSFMWDHAKTVAMLAFNSVTGLWGTLALWLISKVTGPIKTAFGTALDWIKVKWTDIFSGIVGIVKGSINALIGLINGLIRSVANGVNGIIDGLNQLQIYIPEIPGLFPEFFWGGMNLSRVNAPQIPYLAKGAVIPANSQFMAVLGDQKSGRNIEAPENLLRQIFREELGSNEVNVNITFSGTLASLVRELKPMIDKENTRIGSNLISRGVT